MIVSNQVNNFWRRSGSPESDDEQLADLLLQGHTGSIAMHKLLLHYCIDSNAALRTPACASSCFLASSGSIPVRPTIIAVFTSPPETDKSPSAASSSTPAACCTIDIARRYNFWFVACTSTMRLPKVFPSRIIAPVLSILRTIFWAVPAFRRVEPVIT